MRKTEQTTSIPAIQPRLLSVKAAAVYLSCSVWFIRTECWAKRLPGIKLGNKLVFDVSDLDRFVERMKAEAR